MVNPAGPAIPCTTFTRAVTRVPAPRPPTGAARRQSRARRPHPHPADGPRPPGLAVGEFAACLPLAAGLVDGSAGGKRIQFHLQNPPSLFHIIDKPCASPSHAATSPVLVNGPCTDAYHASTFRLYRRGRVPRRHMRSVATRQATLPLLPATCSSFPGAQLGCTTRMPN